MYRFHKILKEDYQKWGDEKFIFEKKDGVYVGHTFKEMIEKVNYLAMALIHLGYKNKKIIIFGDNSYNWMVSDLAVMSFVGISVGISKDSSALDLNNIIKFLKVDLVLYGSEKQDIINQVKTKIKLINIDIELEDMIALGKSLNMPFLTFAETDSEKCVKVVFTSGTTSVPKAVMLSEKNIFAGYDCLKRRAHMDHNDRCYLFLPLHHTYGGIYNFIYSLISGMKIYLCSNLNEMAKELLEVKPTVFCSVPLLYKKFYYAVNGNLEALFNVFGGKIRYLFCGGAKIDEHIRSDYRKAGLKFLCAYALSETASSLSIEYDKDENYNSEGVVFENIEVKIDNPNCNGIGEILVKGDNVFLGYMNNEDATKAAFDKDGYFKTGDLGCIKNKHLYLHGRKRNVLIGDNGENIYPDEIKILLMNMNKNLDNVRLYIENNLLKAILYIREEAVFDYDVFIDKINNKLKKHEKIHAYKVVLKNDDVLKK